MHLHNQVRQELPRFDVFVQSDDRALIPASPTLAEEVHGDIETSRANIVEAFGTDRLPAMSEHTATGVADYFGSRNWQLPQSVVINPTADALTLRSIMQKAKFPSKTDEEFFTGANGQLMSPGGSAQRDLVIFHDWRDKYRTEVRELVEGWGYDIDDDEVERVAELKIADFVVHELAHLAGGLSVSAVVLEKIDGKYHIADRATAGFTDVHDDIPAPAIDDAGDYYTGPALDESWAALQASRFILAQEGYDNLDNLEVEDRYSIGATIKCNEDQSMYYGVAGLHSSMAGMVIEMLDNKQPGIVTTMTAVAEGKVSLPTALSELRKVIPAATFDLLLQPKYSAWERLLEQVQTKKTEQ